MSENNIYVRNNFRLVQDLMSVCSGNYSLENILQLLHTCTEHPADVILSALNQLKKIGVLTDIQPESIKIDKALPHPLKSSASFAKDRDYELEWMQRLEKTLDHLGLDILTKTTQMQRGDVPPSSRFICESFLTSEDGNVRASGFASGESAQIAGLKSASEAIERMASMRVREDITCPASSLTEPYISFNEYLPLSREQTKVASEICCFTEETPWRWIRGSQFTHARTIWVPIELVCVSIPQKGKGQLVTTSGVATRFCANDVALASTLELVERHNLMRVWMSHKSPLRVDLHTLSAEVINRIREWEKFGFEFSVLDISSSGVAVALVVAFGDKFPYFFCGAAASLISFNSAAEEAFFEAEMICCLNPPNASVLFGADRIGPAEHFDYYAHNDRRSKLQWLLEGPSTKSPGEPHLKAADLFDKFNIVYIDLESHFGGLYVGRVLSSQLIPMTFGKGMEITSHEFAPAVQAHLRNPQSPHFFA